MKWQEKKLIHCREHLVSVLIFQDLHFGHLLDVSEGFGPECFLSDITPAFAVPQLCCRRFCIVETKYVPVVKKKLTNFLLNYLYDKIKNIKCYSFCALLTIS